MPRAARPGRERRISVSPEVWNWLLTGERPANNYDLFVLAHDYQPNGPLSVLWSAVGDAVVANFADAHPGRRPATWWKLSSPGPRKRLGGKGMPESDLLACVPTFEYGIPTDWLLDDFIWTWNGGTPPAAYVPFDRDDPPRFESQAAYLKRLRLLLPGELRRLRAADFEPEIIAVTDPESPAGIDDPIGAAALKVPLLPAASLSSRGNNGHA